MLHVQYCVPAAFVRPVQPEELAPVSADIPPAEKRILVSTADQTLTAYEGDEIVLHTQVSTGIPSNGPSPNGIPTDTPQGYFHVEVKVPSRHMGDGDLTSDIEAYELPGVPWVSFFHQTGVALHGAYWHDNFGRMMSHGCVNMRIEDAKWIYRWTSPLAGPQDWNSKGHGTLVQVT
jgi:lipoprotein-anchoring transpeptidase ErfK/SrfK